MSSGKTQREFQPPSDDLKCMRLFYRTYPEHPAEADWFEVALHVEVEEYWPQTHPSRPKAAHQLFEIADRLIQKASCEARFALDVPDSYYTLHPRMALTLSLVFSAVHARELLPGLEAELAVLGIPALRSDR